MYNPLLDEIYGNNDGLIESYDQSGDIKSVSPALSAPNAFDGGSVGQCFAYNYFYNENTYNIVMTNYGKELFKLIKSETLRPGDWVPIYLSHYDENSLNLNELILPVWFVNYIAWSFTGLLVRNALFIIGLEHIWDNAKDRLNRWSSEEFIQYFIDIGIFREVSKIELSSNSLGMESAEQKAKLSNLLDKKQINKLKKTRVKYPKL